MKSHIWAVLPISALLLAAPSPAMERSVAIPSTQPAETAPADVGPACQAQRNSSRGGLGRALLSARNSGLVGAVAGRTGGGYLVGSVAETAIDIGTAEADRTATRAPNAARNSGREARPC